MNTLYVIFGILGFLTLLSVLMYNSLIARKNMVENMYGSIDALLKKRTDMIPNLVASVKEYMVYEKELLTRITQIRSKILNSSSEDEKMDLQNELSGYLKTLMVNVENYPELKASENFIQLQNAIKQVEDEISAARRAYNQAVTDYNNAVEMFPTNIMANIMNLKRKKVFEAVQSDRKNVDVSQMFRDR